MLIVFKWLNWWKVTWCLRYFHVSFLQRYRAMQSEHTNTKSQCYIVSMEKCFKFNLKRWPQYFSIVTKAQLEPGSEWASQIEFALIQFSPTFACWINQNFLAALAKGAYRPHEYNHRTLTVAELILQILSTLYFLEFLSGAEHKSDLPMTSSLRFVCWWVLLKSIVVMSLIANVFPGFLWPVPCHYSFPFVHSKAFETSS